MTGTDNDFWYLIGKDIGPEGNQNILVFKTRDEAEAKARQLLLKGKVTGVMLTRAVTEFVAGEVPIHERHYA